MIVAGSINFDAIATANRFPYTGETLVGSDIRFLPGGKGANQAVAAKRQGVQVALAGCVGADNLGRKAIAFLSEEGIDVGKIRTVRRHQTGLALIVTTKRENTVVYVPGANQDLTARDVQCIRVSPRDVLVSQYEIPSQTVDRFLRVGKAKGARTILNVTPVSDRPRVDLSIADVLVMNLTELAELCSGPIGANASSDCLRRRMEEVRVRADQAIIVTLGSEGVLVLEDRKLTRIRGRKTRVVDVTGAGDCFIGALASQMLLGEPFRRALQYANVAASLCVQHYGGGPAVPLRREVLVEMGS